MNFVSVFTCCKLCQQSALLKCTACNLVRYCCKDHQTQDWKAHKVFCKWLGDELLKRPLTDKTPEAKLLRKQQMAAVYWERLAGEGDAEAQFNLGACHWTGEGAGRVDVKKALQYFLMAAAQGHARAQCQVGFLYATGIGVAKDKKKAFEYNQLSAAQGLAQAQYNLGSCYATARASPRTRRRLSSTSSSRPRRASPKLSTASDLFMSVATFVQRRT